MGDSSDSKELLERYHEALRTRLANEYEQRDRDFLTWVTINGGLAVALGFLFQGLTPLSPGSLMTRGLGMVVLGAIGWFFARAVRGSVESFIYWQSLMTAIMAKLDLAILPTGFHGAWSHIVVRHGQSLCHFKQVAAAEDLKRLPEVSNSKKLAQDLTYYRLELGRRLPWFWALVSVFGELLFGCGVALLCSTKFYDLFSILWPPAHTE